MARYKKGYGEVPPEIVKLAREIARHQMEAEKKRVAETDPYDHAMGVVEPKKDDRYDY